MIYPLWSTDTLKDLVDIAVVVLLVHQVVRLVRGTRAASMVIGLAFLLVMYVGAKFLALATLSWILEAFLSSIIIIVVILFQDEIRRALIQFGTQPFFGKSTVKAALDRIDDVVLCVKILRDRSAGALFVFEQQIGLEEFSESGTSIDGKISEGLILSIFNKDSPLHDGALIISGDRIKAAGCVLPLTQRMDLDITLGTRHRAAIGITERCDAVVVVLSEETRTISIVRDGKIKRGLDISQLRDVLVTLLVRKEDIL